jgi:DnaJ-class molecular chaperone
MSSKPGQPRSQPTGEPKTSLDDVLGYYALLGLSPSASRTQIIDAFRLQTRSTVDEIARKKLEHAYHVLQDRTLRADYDNAGDGKFTKERSRGYGGRLGSGWRHRASSVWTVVGASFRVRLRIRASRLFCP